MGVAAKAQIRWSLHRLFTGDWGQEGRIVTEQQQELLEFAHDLADASGQVILPYFRSGLALDNKAGPGGFDPVTAADRAAEKTIVDLVTSRFPDHGVQGEEFGMHNPEARLRWVIDPIDGTRAFIVGLPVWGTLIGLLDGATPVLGMMNQPHVGERFWAAGDGSCLRGADGVLKRLRTRPCRSLSEAILSTTDPGMFVREGEAERFQTVRQRVRATRYGADCYAYCLLAAGHIDVVVEAGLKPYDIVALVPIIEQAGGRVTTWAGEPAVGGGRIVATGDPRLHEQVLALLAEDRDLQTAASTPR
jgi:histidinol phosphatase-like enzyme (inositol monophosphatase family)